MNFDIARAWKDENYRQSLSDEQMNTLPANPAGELELSSNEMDTVNGGGGSPLGIGGPGGGGGGIGGFGGGFGGGGFAASSRSQFQSLALDCRVTVFSITTNAGFNVLSPVTTFCINNEGR